MSIDLQEWFSMKEGRSSFVPQVPDDAHLIFCHNKQIEDEIVPCIQQAFATRKPVKMLIFGDWGVGKTHLLHHIGWWLEENKEHYPARSVIIEIGDIGKKSKFDEIVQPFLDQLGLDFIVKLVFDCQQHKPNLPEFLKTMGIAPHIAETFSNFLLSPPGTVPVPLVHQSFEYLKGFKSAAQANVGLGQALQQSRDFYNVLASIGEMYRLVNDGERMLFIADEGAKLEGIGGDQATEDHWLNANKLIFDSSNQSFGFIYTVSGKGESELPRCIWEPQIQNRIGENHFEMNTLATPDVVSYLKNLFDEFIDWQRVEALVSDGTIEPGTYDRNSFPFTPDAKARFEDFFNRAQQDSKPRDISNRVDKLAFIALKREQRVISADILEKYDM